jgi:glycosyltransferase involved in cell wall biosynthesis
VLSRSNEPFGLVVLEAMASGCAVIASNRGGLPEACSEAGILTDPDHLDEIVRSLRCLATDPDFLVDQKKKSVARAAQADWSNTTSLLEQVVTRSSS